MSKEQTPRILEPLGQAGRASRAPGQLWQVPTFFAGVAAFLAVFLTAPSRGDNALPAFSAELSQLRRALESASESPAVLVARAEELLVRVGELPRKAGETHFLAGSAYLRKAELEASDNRAKSLKKAVDHLDEALHLNVATQDQAPLKYRLGLALYKENKDLKRAVDLMGQSAAKGADRPAQAYGTLVHAYLALPKQNLEGALAASQKQLELTDSRNHEEMGQARLLRAKVLLYKDQRPDALKELEGINPAVSKPLRVEARLLQARVCEEEQLWNKAIPVWTKLLDDADLVPGGKARVHYCLGLACRNAEPRQAEQALSHWEQAFALGGDEGQAAGLRLAEMRLYGSRADAVAGVEVLAQVLAGVHTANDYAIKTLDLQRAREIVGNTCQYFLDKEDYEQTNKVAELYKKIAPPGAAEEYVARAAEGQARELNKQLPTPADNAKLEEVKAQFYRAAVAYGKAAAARAEGQADAYWKSAQCYLAAKDLTGASAALAQFVELEKNPGRLAEGYLIKAETLSALGEKDKARKDYHACIQFPNTPYAFRARYQLALDEIGKKNYKEAEAILVQNLELKGAVEDRSAHEKSLYKIADLYFLEKDFDKAVIYYQKAIQTYPQSDPVLAARGQLGECYFELATQTLETSKNAGKDKKGFYDSTRKHWLDQGAVVCETLADELEHKARQTPLVQEELNLLRKALFGAAQLHVEMNDFDEALRRYETLQTKYRKQGEGLIAGLKIWRLVEVMSSLPEKRQLVRKAAADALEKIKVDLESMSEESDAFKGAGVWTKRQWVEWAHWVDDRLKETASPPRVLISQP
jgi:tetratricopeptide (TPR) repeat protein